jgi:pimeloyl-ACP methyl ester carboxylesterase
MQHADRLRRPGAIHLLTATLASLALLVPLSSSATASPSKHSDRGGPRPTIVLVHGDWADGSSWNGVTRRLVHKGYTVLAPPNPLRGPSSDAAHLRSFLESIEGPIVLVAHSYGGFVITNAATGNPNVKALVYVDAFAPDAGETLAELAVGSCLDAATAFNAVPGPGGVVDLYLRHEPNPPYTGFRKCFANGVHRQQAALLEAAQRPAAVAEFGEPSGPPAWATIPSWSLIGTADHVITPAQQRMMSARAGAHTSTVAAGHLSLVSRPDRVAHVIEAAVQATT